MSVVALTRSGPSRDAELQDLNSRIAKLQAELTDISKILEESRVVITTVGTHRLYAGKLTLDVFEEKEGLNYRVTRILEKGSVKNQSASPREPFIQYGADWFAFAESADVVWIFNGRDVLNCVELGEGVWRTTDSVVVPDIVNRAPQAVRNRLPNSFLDTSEEK
jgi:hypothetical protein